MSIQKLIFKPGVNREGTTLTNEGSWFETDKVRFRSGFPEKIGGWAAISSNTFLGVCRSMWNWITLKNFNLLGIGTNQKFYIENGGNYYDITPIQDTPGSEVTDIEVTDGSYVALITVANGPSFQTGDIVEISGVVNPIGGVSASVFNQQYFITYVSGTTFTIRLRQVSPLEEPLGYVTATSNATETGLSAPIDFLLAVGLPIYTVGTGWGVGPWSRAGWGEGYTVGGTGVGAGLQLRLWSQATYGEDLIINPRGGALYLWQPGNGPLPDFGTRAQLISGTNVPTQVNEVMVSDATRIVIAFGCTDYDPPIGTGDFDPMLIRWSTNEDYLEWTPAATNQAGSYRLSHGSEIIAVMQTRQEILIWTDAALYSMQYIGPDYIWKFTILADNISIASPNSMTTANGMVFWMGTDKFYMYSGRVETLPSALRQFVFQDINRDQGYQVFASTNEGYSEVWWFYCSADSNMVDKYVVFNYLDQVWYYGNMQRTAWLDSALRQYPQAAISIQETLLSSALDATNNEISVFDASSFPNSGFIQIDDEIIYYGANNITTLTQCVRGVLGSVADSHDVDANVIQYASNLILFHEYGNDDASNLERPREIEAFIQSSDIDLDDGDRYMFVWQMVPDFSFDGSTTANPNRPEVLVQLRPRQNPGSAYGYGNSPDVKADASQSYDTRHTYAVQEFTDIVNTRIRGRQVALRITSDTLGTKWQLGALRINMRPDGRR